MKNSGNCIFGLIISSILLFFIFWMVQIETRYKYSDTTYSKKIEQIIKDQSLEESVIRGRKLFVEEDCSSCHKPTGLQTPSSMKLINISDIRDKKWLFQFIRDEKSLLEAKDPDVLDLKETYKWADGKHDKKHLTDEQLNDILNYLSSF